MSRATILAVAAAVLVIAPAAPALADPPSSASYQLSDQVFNAGGHPHQGTILASAGYRIRLDALGDGSSAPPMYSASYGVDGGMTPCYVPPGEVSGLQFQDKVTLVWQPERSGGAYNVYRDLVGALGGLEYGQCEQDGLTAETATDADLPATGLGFFYLVTAENLLTEEGSRGSDSAGTDRGHANACP